MMSQKDQALRKTMKFLRCVAEGAPVTREEFKLFVDLCGLALPMKYRLSKEEVAEIKSHPWKEPDDKAVQ
jgi:hypothetical protein